MVLLQKHLAKALHSSQLTQVRGRRQDAKRWKGLKKLANIVARGSKRVCGFGRAG